MPRLSVDIDLTYLPVNERNAALKGISMALSGVSAKFGKILPDGKVSAKKIGPSGLVAGLIVRRGDATVKIESNLVTRGSVLTSQVKSLSNKAQDLFETSVDMRVLSDAELIWREALRRLGQAASQKPVRYQNPSGSRRI